MYFMEIDDNILSFAEKKVLSLEKKMYLAKQEQRYGDADEIEDQIYEIEKEVYLKAVSDFLKSASNLSDIWTRCNDKMQDKTMVDSFPFSDDFETVNFKMMRWYMELKDKLEGEE